MHHNNGEDEDKDVSPSPTTNPNPNSSKHTRIMQNLRAAVFSRLAESHPNNTLSPSQIAAIELRLAQAFPSFQTPTHPTYASMIQKAIEELNEEGGSTDGSISDYIVNNYTGLPWAHRSYLSHYLGKLCENGEIVRTASNCYTIPGLIGRPNSNTRLLKGRKRKECESEERDSGEEGLMGVEDEVCFDEGRVFTRKVPKRSLSLVVYEEDKEVGGKEVVEREDDAIRKSETPRIEGEEKPKEQIGGDEVVKESEFNCNERDEGVGCIEDATPQGGLVKYVGEKLSPKEGQDEVITEVLALDHDDSIEGKTELLGLSTTEKTLPVEFTDEVEAETEKLGCESGDANLMLIPIESEKSVLEENTHIVSCGDVTEEPLKESAIVGSDDHSFRTADLMIVPFKDDTPIPVVQKEKEPVVTESMKIIVCGLSCQQLSGQPKRKQLVYRPRFRKSKKKLLLLLDESQIASSVGPKLLEYGRDEIYPQTCLETKLDQTSQDPSMLEKPSLLIEQAQTSSPYGTSPMIPVEEGSRELEPERAKSHLDPSPSSGATQELVVLMNTDDLDVPLNQILNNCCKQRKLSEDKLTSKILPLVSEPPQRRKKELTTTKRKQKESQQRKYQRKSRAQKGDDLEAGSATATETGVFSSFHMDGGCDDGKKRLEDQEPRDQSRVLDGQQHESGEKQQKSREVGLRESSPPENHKQQKQTEKGDVSSCDPEPTTAAIMVEKVAMETKEESECSACRHHKEIAAGELGKDAHPLNLRSEQQIKQLKSTGRRSRNQTEEALSQPKADGQTACQPLIVEPLEVKIERRGRSRKQKECTEDEQNKQPKKAGRGRPKKKKEETIEVATPKQKRHRRGRSQVAEEGIKENEATMSHQQEEKLHKKEEEQKNTDDQVIFQDSELSGTVEVSLPLGIQSDRDPRVQKQHGQEDESHKSDKEAECCHFSDEQSGKSEGEVYGTPCYEEQQLTVNEALEQVKDQNEDELPGLELGTEIMNNTPSQDEKQCELHEEKEGKTPKQKSTAKSKAIEVPLSSKACLRSRTVR